MSVLEGRNRNRMPSHRDIVGEEGRQRIILGIEYVLREGRRSPQTSYSEITVWKEAGHQVMSGRAELFENQEVRR
jgi:hypothetical protein